MQWLASSALVHLGDDLSTLGLSQSPGASRFRELRPLHGDLFRFLCVDCFGRTSHAPPVFVSIAGEPIRTFWRNVKVPVYAPLGFVASCAHKVITKSHNIRQCSPMFVQVSSERKKRRAGEGNRTPVCSLGSCRSAI